MNRVHVHRVGIAGQVDVIPVLDGADSRRLLRGRIVEADAV
jgi:hypothetical protein